MIVVLLFVAAVVAVLAVSHQKPSPRPKRVRVETRREDIFPPRRRK